MLERIEEIRGVGLFHDANGKPHKFQKATVLYADNGRGKSTLANILRSLSEGDAASVLERKTIDGTFAPSVTLQFSNAHKVTLSGNRWSEARPEIIVFDADFVERNVHSGGVVNTGHRKNLLEFALGEKAVTARSAESKASKNASDAAKEVQRISDLLSGHHQDCSLSDFEKLPKIADPDKDIEDLEKRLVAARNSESLLKRAIPEKISIPQMDLTSSFEVLGTTIENVQDDAEATVRAHVESLDGKDTEAWLSQGQEFDNDENCPYCAQSTTGIDLITAYRTHFNEAYIDLKNKVQQLDKQTAAACSESLVTQFAQKLKTANSSTGAWEDQVKVAKASFDDATALTKLSEIRVLLSALVKSKQSNLTVSFGRQDDRKKASEIWSEITAMMEATNTQIAEAKTIIEKFQKELSAEDIPTITTTQQRIRLGKKRHSDGVIDLFKALQTARAASKSAEESKAKARTTLNALMKQTLSDYERSINTLLDKFGAAFKIEKMDTNFRGGSPRSEYGLALRGKSVPLEGGPPSFGTALSEGDKRTLAFAFFVASTIADPNLSSRVIVVDDPMCSLDLNRKQQTRTELKEIGRKSKQLIVLAHDIYFVRDLQKDLAPPPGASYSVCAFGLSHAGNGYTKIDSLDVNKECQSPYYHHHQLLVDYVNSGTGDSRQVAKAIRVLLEGYLHRRFPSLIPEGLMFGQVVNFIDNGAPAGSPVMHAKCLVDELREINTYAGQFHHDTNPGNADTVHITPAELTKFCKRALDVVHKGVA